MSTRVIVCGGRDFTDRERCFNVLDSILSEYDAPEIVSGHANGADKLGEEYAKSRNLFVEIFPANFGLYGKYAGPLRNQRMLEYASEATPIVVAFWDGSSSGTKNMIEIARAAGVKTYIENYKHSLS